MDNEGYLPERTQILAASYQRINDEGRDVLDRFVQKLEEINGEPEKIKNISFLTSFKPFYNILNCLIFIIFITFFILSSCTFPVRISDNTESASRDAQQLMEGALRGNTSLSSTPSVQITQGGRQPNWINDPYIVYSRDRFIAAIGSAPTRVQAEERAFFNLAAIFGHEINGIFNVTTTYTETVNRGVLSVSENNSIHEQITRAASMERLIGAEIGNVWDSGQGTVFAVAFMERAKTISIYSDIIIANNQDISLLTTMSNNDKYSFNGYARFKLAEFIAEINSNFAAIITLAGGSVAALNLRSPVFFKNEANNIKQNITISVDVKNDRANRIQDSFAQILSSEDFRFRTRGNNPFYTLDVHLNFSERIFPGNNLIWCMYEVSANLIENSTGASLFSFSFNDREGHTTYENAQLRAFTSIERTIAVRYPPLLRDYLASLIPQK
jgi:hypothetical protein